MPDPNQPRFSVRSVEHYHLCNGFKIVATTDIPCNLVMRWSTVEPQIHTVPRFRRGIFLHADRYICFVAYHDNYQEEAGDTLIHTFIKRDWPICETRHFNFWATVAGLPCASTTALFKLHFDILHITFFPKLSNRTLWASSGTWNTCHDTPTGTIATWHGAPSYFLAAGARLTASYFIYRGFLSFDTSFLASQPQFYDAFLQIYCRSVEHTGVVPPIHLNITQGVQADPIVTTNYGDQLPYTTIGGQADMFDLVVGQYNSIYFDDTGLGWINPAGITKLCMRGDHDVANSPPGLGSSVVTFHSAQATVDKRPRLVVCVPPP